MIVCFSHFISRTTGRSWILWSAWAVFRFHEFVSNPHPSGHNLHNNDLFVYVLLKYVLVWYVIVYQLIFTGNVLKFFANGSSVQHRGGNSWKKTPRGSQDKKVGHEQTQPEPEGGWIDRGLFRKLTTIDQTILNETFICKI